MTRTHFWIKSVLLVTILLEGISECELAVEKQNESYAELSLVTHTGKDLTEEPQERFLRTATFSGFKGTSDIFVIPRHPDLKLINSFCKILRKLSDPKTSSRIVLFAESTSLILNSPKTILRAFKAHGARILLSTGSNTTGFIGYASDLTELFKCQQEPVESFKVILTTSREDDAFREKYTIKVDAESAVFYTIDPIQDLNTIFLSLDKDLGQPNSQFLIPTLQNTRNSRPVLILQQNSVPDNSGLILNWLGNYLTPTLPQDQLSDNEVSAIVSSKTTTLTLAIFLTRPTPFIEEFFEYILNLNFDKSRIHLFVFNEYKYHVDHVDEFLDTNGHLYGSVQLIRSKQRIKEWVARKMAVETALRSQSNYTLFVDSTAHLENPETIQLLIRSNKPIVSPLLCRPSNDPDAPRICNFYGAITSDGMFGKATDYEEISNGKRFGIWNVPYISGAYLIHAKIFKDPKTRPNFISGLNDAESGFCINNQRRGIFMHVTNEWFGGTLVSADNFDIRHINNELYTLFDNRGHWERRYLHPNFSQATEPDEPLIEPCKDVYWFPIVTPKFCEEFIEEMEGHGGWSDGSIQSKGDLYPTVEIEMHEIGFGPHWNEFLRLYVQPLQLKAFPGYEIYPPRTEQGFVVKYSADNQRELKPHFDESTYTINIALNRVNVDYEGGGCRFTRGNCSVTHTRRGWMMMHPGQFTHKHEGLKITKGVRYILVAFVDPPAE